MLAFAFAWQAHQLRQPAFDGGRKAAHDVIFTSIVGQNMNSLAQEYEGVYDKSQFCWKALKERGLVLLMYVVQHSFESPRF